MALMQRESLDDLTRWEQFYHWEPFKGIEHLQEEVNRLFERLMPQGSEEMKRDFAPSAEMEEGDDVIYLKLEVPGMEAKDLEVEVTEGAVSIKGERKVESRTEEQGMVRSELHYGKFERRIPLPVHIQPDKVQAECKNGMLNMVLPKVEAEQRQAVKVPINS
jgi:HSP20 family protein